MTSCFLVLFAHNSFVKSSRDLDLDQTKPPLSNSSELFSYTTICSSFKWIEALCFFVIVDT